MIKICEECMHREIKERCRCTEEKVKGIMYIGIMKGCIWYNEKTKGRCKKKVNEEMYLCEKHNKKIIKR